MICWGARSRGVVEAGGGHTPQTTQTHTSIPDATISFSTRVSRRVVSTKGRLRGDVKKPAVTYTHFGTRRIRVRSGKRLQNGHSTSPSSISPHRAHRVRPRISSRPVSWSATG